MSDTGDPKDRVLDYALGRLLDGVELIEADAPEDATGIGLAVAKAAQVLGGSVSKSRVVILLTDGEENVAQALERAGVKLSSVPKLKCGMEELTQLDISPQQGFMLTRIDGSYDIQSILKMSPMPKIDAQIVGSQDVGEPTSSKRDKSPYELQAGVYADVPLQRRKARGKIQAAQAKLQQLLAKRRFTEDKIVAEIQAAYAAMLAAYERVGQARESAPRPFRKPGPLTRAFEHAVGVAESFPEGWLANGRAEPGQSGTTTVVMPGCAPMPAAVSLTWVTTPSS